MFASNICEFEGCSSIAVTDGKYCFNHIENKKLYSEKIIERIKSEQKIINLNISGITLNNIQITGKKFFFM